MRDSVEDFLSDVSSLDATLDTGLVPAANSVFDLGFSLDAFTQRLASGYEIKDKRSSALMRFGPLLHKKKVQLKLAKQFIAALKRGGPVRFIVLKSRKLGVSTLTDVLLTELAVQIPQWKSAIVAHTEPASKELFHPIRMTLERMENAKRVPEIRVNNEEMVRFGAKSIDRRRGAGEFGHESTIKCAEAGGKYILSGETVNGLHLSECAKYDAVGGLMEQERMIISALGAVPKAGCSIVVAESTANGQQGWFYNTWLAAVNNTKDEDGLGWIPIFIPWHEDPDCWAAVPPNYNWNNWDEADIERERALVKKYRLKPEQLYYRRRTLKQDFNDKVDYWDQEFPDSWETAFVASGNGLFQRKDIERMAANTADALYRADTYHSTAGVEIRQMGHGGVFVWEDPQPGADYVIGSDTADGVTFGVDGAGRNVLDASTFSIWKRTHESMEQVAECSSQADNFEFGRAIAAWAHRYNNAMINVERNRAHAVLAGIRATGYPDAKLFRPPLNAAVSEGLGGQYFFAKSAANSKMLIDTLYSWARERLVIRSKPLIHELRTLRREPNGRVETNGKDLTIACAMAVIADAHTEPVEIDVGAGALKKKREQPTWDIDPGDQPKQESDDRMSYDGDGDLYTAETFN